jgi:hypothetical protein
MKNNYSIIRVRIESDLLNSMRKIKDNTGMSINFQIRKAIEQRNIYLKRFKII